MAGRERKSSVKHLGVKKETDTWKLPTSQTEANIIAVATAAKKEQQRNASLGRKAGLRNKATSDVNSKKAPNSTDTKAKAANAFGKKLTSSDTQSKNSQSSKVIQDQKPNNLVISEPATNQQNSKSSKLDKAIKTETTENAVPAGESNVSNTAKKAQAPKIRRLNRLSKLGAGATDTRTGTRNRNAPYVTRSDSPARILRNGKRRKLKDPSLLEGLDVKCSKRRRLLSSTKDGSVSDVAIKSELLDDQASIAGSDISYNDSRVENGKSNWKVDHDVKPVIEGNTAIDKKRLQCTEDPAQITDNCLGKAISNKIAELISRNKFLETLGKDLAPKTEEALFKPVPVKTEDKSLHDSFTNSDTKVADINSKVCEKETGAAEKCRNVTEQNHAKSCLSPSSAEKKVPEIAQSFPSQPVVKKEPDHLEVQLKNGQNRSYRLSSRSLSEKAAKRIRDFKLGRSKTKMYQSCPSSSGMFYVVEDPADIASRQIVSSSSGECSSSNSGRTSHVANNSNDGNVKSEEIETSTDQSKATINVQPSTSLSTVQKGAVESRENLNTALNRNEEENTAATERPDSTMSDMSIKSVLECENETNCNQALIKSCTISPGKTVVMLDCSDAQTVSKLNTEERKQKLEKTLHFSCLSGENVVPTCSIGCVKDDQRIATVKNEENANNLQLQNLEILENKLSELAQAVSNLESEKKVNLELDKKVNLELEKKVNLESEKKMNLESEKKAKLELEKKMNLESEKTAPLKMDESDISKCLKITEDCKKSTDLCLELLPKDPVESLENGDFEQKSDAANAHEPVEDGKTLLETMEVDSTIKETSKSSSLMVQQLIPDSIVEDVKNNSIETEVASKINCSDNIAIESDGKKLEILVTADAIENSSLLHENNKHDNVLAENNLHGISEQELKNCENVQAETIECKEGSMMDSLKNQVTSCSEETVESRPDNLIADADMGMKELPCLHLSPNIMAETSSAETKLLEEPENSMENSTPNGSTASSAEQTKDLEDTKPTDSSGENQRAIKQCSEDISLESKIADVIEALDIDCEMQNTDAGNNDVQNTLKMSLEEQESENITANLGETDMGILNTSCAEECKVMDLKKNETEEYNDSSERNDNFLELVKLDNKTEDVLSDAANAEGGETTENYVQMEISEKKKVNEEMSPEELAVKESVLSALGLQPLRSLQTSTAVSSHEKPCGNYTGTLKTVIKLSRSSPEKRHRSTVKFLVKQGKSQNAEETTISGGKGDEDSDESDYDGDEKIEYSISHESGSIESNSAAAGSRKNGKSSYPYRSYFDISSNPHLLSEKNSTGESPPIETAIKEEGKTPSVKQSDNLVIPEKSSSFSIHPERLCSDVCSYCFGKFGSLDTPCHIAQLKSVERQQKILEAETHLTADSCLCDACYRHVDRKANCPSYKPNKKRQYHRSNSAQMKSMCCVQGCSQPAHHHVRRKWLVKLKRSIAKKVPIDLDKMPQHLPFPVCSQHYYWIDYFMVCGICKRRLTRNHMYPLGPEVRELNVALINDGIPVRLSEKLFLCKLCRYFASLRMKYKNPSQLSGNHKMFFQSYRKRILHYHDIEEMDDEEASEDANAPARAKRRKTKNPSASALKEDDEEVSGGKSKSSSPAELEDLHSNTNVPSAVSHVFNPAIDYSNLGDPLMERSGASTPMIDYSSLGNVAVSSAETMSSRPVSQKKSLKLERVKPPKIKLKLGKKSVEKIGSLSISHDEQGNTTSILLPDRDGLEVTPVFDDLSRTSFHEQEELNLHADFDFQSKKQDQTSSSRQGEWEKCTATIQFDKETKSVFQELHRPYGNYSSFFRHLVLLEKHWRSGNLVLSSRASSRAINYLNSVQNRIRAYEGHSSLSPCIKPPQSSSATPATSQSSSVPIIDLPLKGHLSGGILAAAEGSLRPVTITNVSMSQHSGSLTSVSSQHQVPVFTFPQTSTSSSVSRKVPVESVSVATRNPGQQNKRIPNILQVTAGGKSFSIMPGFSQLRQFRNLQPRKLQPKPSVQTPNIQIQQTQSTSASNFEPMICDVRSLAMENGGLWERSSVEITPHNDTNNSQTQPQSQQPSISVSIMPNTGTAVQPTINSPKPSTIVTPTGIILSRKPERSVTTITETKDSVSKPKTVPGKKDDVQKKVVSEKNETTRTTPLLELNDSALTLTVPEKRNLLPKTKC